MTEFNAGDKVVPVPYDINRGFGYTQAIINEYFPEPYYTAVWREGYLGVWDDKNEFKTLYSDSGKCYFKPYEEPQNDTNTRYKITQETETITYYTVDGETFNSKAEAEFHVKVLECVDFIRDCAETCVDLHDLKVAINEMLTF